MRGRGERRGRIKKPEEREKGLKCEKEGTKQKSSSKEQRRLHGDLKTALAREPRLMQKIVENQTNCNSREWSYDRTSYVNFSSYGIFSFARNDNGEFVPQMEFE